MKYMVDTNIINWLVDGSLSAGDFAKDASFVATHIQHDELSKTRDSKRRELLLDRFTSLIDSTVLLSQRLWTSLKSTPVG